MESNHGKRNCEVPAKYPDQMAVSLQGSQKTYRQTLDGIVTNVYVPVTCFTVCVLRNTVLTTTLLPCH